MATMTAAAVRAATVRAAAVSSTIMTPIAVLMVVMVALDVRIIAEIMRKKCLDCCVTRTADTAVELDARIGKCHLCATADTSADKNICSECF